ncbi:MAG: hypothetical protein NC095_06550 [Muribaculum sp.]|nr:hypothetical protein [Muribaculum sp.]
MKQFLAFILATLISVAGFAQSETLEQALSRITNLEATVNTQSQQLAKISSDLDAVLAQNLALKKNLKLTPTIAKAKIFDNIEYRVLEVTGDKSTNTIHVTMTVENVGDEDIRKTYYCRGNEIIDEFGTGYNGKERHKMTINGVSDNLSNETINHHVNVPLTIELEIKKYNSDAQYIKYMSLGLQNTNNMGTQYAVFENLPIKWVDEIDD